MITSLTTAEGLAPQLELAAKVDVRGCVPSCRLVVVRTAVPVASRLLLPIDVVPSKNRTLPAEVRTPITSAFKVTDWPAYAGFGETLKVVNVGHGATTSVSVADCES